MTIITERDLMTALSVIVAEAAAGRPATCASLAAYLGISTHAVRDRRDRLMASGLVTAPRVFGGSRPIRPTAWALSTDLPPPVAPKVTALSAPKVRRRRPCMRCGASMFSDGPHHRHCDRCRRHLNEQASVAAYAP